MEPFPTFPTEAFLLGLAFGEYVVPRQLLPRAGPPRFLAVLREHLEPIVTTFLQEVETETNQDDLPDDLMWVVTHDLGKTGISQSAPNVIFEERDGLYFRVHWNNERRSFIEVLNEYLEDAVQRTLDDRKKGLLRPSESMRDMRVDLERQWEELLRIVLSPSFPPEDTSSKTVPAKKAIGNLRPSPDFEHNPSETAEKEEDHRLLCKLLIQLVKYNEVQSEFSAGYLFGVLGRILKEYTDAFFRDDGSMRSMGEWEDIADDIATYWIAICTELLKHPVVRGLDRVMRIIQDASSGLRDAKFRETSSPGTEPDDAEWEVDPRESIWPFWKRAVDLGLCIGETLASLEPADDAARRVEWSLSTPRTFRHYFDATGDRVRLALAQTEQLLNEHPNGNEAATMVITILSPAIEAITRQTFTNVVAERRGFTEKLHEKRRFGTSQEQRFAGIALNLLSIYRNPVQHEFATFESSCHEAQYFLAGIRVLLELSKRIQRGDCTVAG